MPVKHIRDKCPYCDRIKIRESGSCKPCYYARAKNKNHSAWKGGRHKLSTGYIRVYKPEHPFAQNGKYVFEHTLVMEKRLGRYMRRDELVHHKNGIKDNNENDNLELWCRGHPRGQRVEDLLAWAKEIISRYENET